MNTPTATALLLATCLATAVFSGCASDQKQSAAGAPLTVEETVDVTVTSKVKAIDQATRIVTLEDEKGNRSTFVVGTEVKRLNEVKVGDTVKASYKASLLAELRAPTAEELANPIAAVEVAARAPRSDAPAIGVAQGVRVVTKVEAVDVPNMRVTLRGPLGDLAVVKGRKAENLKRLRVGDTIVITYAEAVAVSLEKVGGK